MARRGQLPKGLSRLMKPPPGYEGGGVPSIKVTAETSFWPKSTRATPSPPKAAKMRKPPPMEVKIVAIGKRARLGMK